jgi:threonine dehydrogenase-like Zn-dependent dehydrogenase
MEAENEWNRIHADHDLPGPLRVGIDHEPPMPKIPHPRDTIVQITRSRICESELHPYNGDVPDPSGDNLLEGAWGDVRTRSYACS